MICLIDEIFKGTNSADRIIGATETIRRLSVPHSIVLVSTHDFELCNLENNSHVKMCIRDRQMTAKECYMLPEGNYSVTCAASAPLPIYLSDFNIN